MEGAVHEVIRHVVLAVNVVAVLVILVGVVEAIIGTLRVMLSRTASGNDKRAVWLDFARWLVAGLTFQLAADIIETTIAPTWDDIGRLAAIAAIRTLLTYFLDRDVDAIRERQRARPVEQRETAA